MQWQMAARQGALRDWGLGIGLSGVAMNSGWIERG